MVAHDNLFPYGEAALGGSVPEEEVMLKHTITLTAAEVNALNTTSRVLVPAPAVDELLVPQSFVLQRGAGTVHVGAGDLHFGYDAAGHASDFNNTSTFPLTNAGGGSSATTNANGTQLDEPPGVRGKAILLSASAAFTGGDTSAPITVTTTYSKV